MASALWVLVVPGDGVGDHDGDGDGLSRKSLFSNIIIFLVPQLAQLTFRRRQRRSSDPGTLWKQIKSSSSLLSSSLQSSLY